MTANHSNEDGETVLQQDKTQFAEPLSELSRIDTHEKNALPIGTTLEDYEIIDIVGWGGFGIVYLADDNLGRKVAIKEYMPTSLARRIDTSTVNVISKKYEDTFLAGLRSFVNEARLLAQFDHPSLIKVFRFWEANGTAYMVMPFYQGKTLKETLHNMQEPPEEAWLKFLLEHLLDAIDVLHKAHCFHRDISPDNVLILPNRKPVLLDFGAARHVINDMTHSLTVILKPGFAPIEQYGEIATLKQGAWTDIYALAAVIYLAISGKTPVPSVSRVVSDTLVPLGELGKEKYSKQFLEAIDKGLAIRPEDRPQDIAEFRKLLGISQTPATQYQPAELPPPLTQRKKFRKIALVSGIMCLLVASVVLYNSMTVENKQPDSAPEHISEKPSGADTTLVDRKFTPLIALNEIFEKRDIRHAVSVLVNKTKLRIGQDSLNIQINSTKSGYVYLLMAGSNQDDLWLLFPNKIDSMNRIEAGISLTIPRPDLWALPASGPPGINHFVIIVSTNQRDFSAAGLTHIGSYAKFPYQEAQHLYSNHDGYLPLFAGKEVCQETVKDACSGSFGAAFFSIEEID
ncbi:MAG: serine/threonine-protein kinase [Nitrosomonas sp.]|nr:serine/threonine-protein kinase [Nitrosomonas sp.]